MSTSSTITEMLDDAAEFLDGGVDDLHFFLDDVAALGSEAAPTPSAELAELFAGTPLVRQVRPVRRPLPTRKVRVRGRVAGLAAAAVAGFSVTGAAAFANELPVPMQRVVAHFSESYLPFAFPRPVGDPPADGGTVTPGSPAQGGDAPATTGYGESGGFASTSPEGPTRGLVGITGKLDGRTNLDRSGDAAPAVTPGSVPGDTSLGLGGAEQPSTGTSVPAGGSSPDAAGTTSVAGADPGTGTASGTGSDPGSGTGATSTPPGNAYAGAGNAGKGGTQGNPAAPPPRAERDGLGRAVRPGAADRREGCRQARRRGQHGRLRRPDGGPGGGPGRRQREDQGQGPGRGERQEGQPGPDGRRQPGRGVGGAAGERDHERRWGSRRRVMTQSPSA